MTTKTKNHTLCDGHGSDGNPLQVLVPFGSDMAAVAAHHGCSELLPSVVVTGECLERWMEQQRKPRAAATDEQCATIYALYPRKVGRPNAMKAIKAAVASAGYETVIKAALGYAEAVQKWPEADKEFVPHAATFFRQERYRDDPSTWQRRNGKQAAAPDYESGF